MAKFIGIPGEFLEDRAIKRRWTAILTLFGVMCIVMFGLGYLTALNSLWWSLAAAVAIVIGVKRADRLSKEQLQRIQCDESGAFGEREIVRYLKQLPDTYAVVCDLSFADSYGNIDHLVIGPTGVFAIDVKNWRGTVTSDGKGELLLNRRPTDKRNVHAFTARTMDLKERICALTKLDPYIQCVFAFPRTGVDAKWGSTGTVHCMRTDQITGYITAYQPKHAPSTADIRRLVSAAKALKNIVDNRPSKSDGAEEEDG